MLSFSQQSQNQRWQRRSSRGELRAIFSIVLALFFPLTGCVRAPQKAQVPTIKSLRWASDGQWLDEKRAFLHDQHRLLTGAALVDEEAPYSALSDRFVHEEGRSVVVTLRSSLTWTDGKPLRAPEIAFLLRARIAAYAKVRCADAVESSWSADESSIGMRCGGDGIRLLVEEIDEHSLRLRTPKAVSTKALKDFFGRSALRLGAASAPLASSLGALRWVEEGRNFRRYEARGGTWTLQVERVPDAAQRVAALQENAYDIVEPVEEAWGVPPGYRIEWLHTGRWFAWEGLPLVSAALPPRFVLPGTVAQRACGSGTRLPFVAADAGATALAVALRVRALADEVRMKSTPPAEGTRGRITVVGEAGARGLCESATGPRRLVAAEALGVAFKERAVGFLSIDRLQGLMPLPSAGNPSP